MTSSSKLWEPFVWHDKTETGNLQITYYYIDPSDPKKRLWIRAPFDDSLMVVDPYTDNDFISKHVTTTNGVKLFKIPSLRRISFRQSNNKNALLIALLWLKYHILYENEIVSKQQEFYKCSDLLNNYLLIPLYAQIGYRPKKNPILIYHSGTIKNALLIAIPEIYDGILDIFGNFVNRARVIMNGEKRFLVQFNEYPGCFLS